MDLTITDNPTRTLQQIGWVVTGPDYKPIRLCLPSHSRCWSFFTKPAAVMLAAHTRGEVYCQRAPRGIMREVVSVIPPEIIQSLTAKEEAKSKRQ